MSALRYVILLWLLALLTPASAQTAIPRRPARPAVPGRSLEVRDAEFFSASLQRKMHYRLLIPAGYENANQRFPVLYLLHGLYGDYTNWDSLTDIAEYAYDLRILVVMPDADNSWYSNSASVKGDRFEDYIVKDVVNEIDARYRTLPDRAHRAVAGLSMGGYAAIKFGLKYPALFFFAGSSSGALAAARTLAEENSEYRGKLLEVFGPPDGQTRAENDVFKLVLAADAPSSPYFYVDCGSADSFLGSNRSLVEQLNRRGFRYEYHEFVGGHGWDFWDAAGRRMLNAMTKLVAGPKGGWR